MVVVLGVGVGRKGSERALRSASCGFLPTYGLKKAPLLRRNLIVVIGNPLLVIIPANASSHTLTQSTLSFFPLLRTGVHHEQLIKIAATEVNQDQIKT